MVLPLTSSIDGARVAATVGPATTTRVTVATTVVGRATMVRMSGILGKSSFVCCKKGRILSGMNFCGRGHEENNKEGWRKRRRHP